MGTNFFYLVTLTLKFDLLLKNFNLGHSFLIRRGRAFIFHIYIQYDKTFPWVPKFWIFDIFLQRLQMEQTDFLEITH